METKRENTFEIKESDHLMYFRKVQQGKMFHATKIVDLENVERKPTSDQSFTRPASPLFKGVFKYSTVVLQNAPTSDKPQVRFEPFDIEKDLQKPEDMLEEKSHFASVFAAVREHAKVYGFKKPHSLMRKSMMKPKYHVIPSIFAALKHLKNCASRYFDLYRQPHNDDSVDDNTNENSLTSVDTQKCFQSKKPAVATYQKRLFYINLIYSIVKDRFFGLKKQKQVPEPPQQSNTEDNNKSLSLGKDPKQVVNISKKSFLQSALAAVVDRVYGRQEGAEFSSTRE